MANKCSNCGVDVKSDDKFCINCGRSLLNGVITPASMQQPVSQQYDSQTKYCSKTEAKKSKKGLIAAVISVIAFIIIIALLLMLFLGNNASYDEFIGSWNLSSPGDTDNQVGTLSFQANGDLKAGYIGFEMKIGTWEVNGDELCIDSSIGGSIFTESVSGKQCMSYSFSDGGDTLTLQDPSGMGGSIVLTKQ
jgi:hypothetical protein